MSELKISDSTIVDFVASKLMHIYIIYIYMFCVDVEPLPSATYYGVVHTKKVRLSKESTDSRLGHIYIL